jgi:hypothetical protein
MMNPGVKHLSWGFHSVDLISIHFISEHLMKLFRPQEIPRFNSGCHFSHDYLIRSIIREDTPLTFRLSSVFDLGFCLRLLSLSPRTPWPPILFTSYFFTVLSHWTGWSDQSKIRSYRKSLRDWKYRSSASWSIGYLINLAEVRSPSVTSSDRTDIDVNRNSQSRWQTLSVILLLLFGRSEIDGRCQQGRFPSRVFGRMNENIPAYVLISDLSGECLVSIG